MAETNKCAESDITPSPAHNICGPGLQFCLLFAAFPRFRGRWWLQAAGRCDYDYTGQARPWVHILDGYTYFNCNNIMGVYRKSFY